MPASDPPHAPALKDQVTGWMAEGLQGQEYDRRLRQTFDGVAHSFHEQVSKGHGRLERRECRMITDPEELSYVDPGGHWAGLGSVAKVSYQRYLGSGPPEEPRYYICSHPAAAAALLKATREHWGIENSLHWVLDMAFDEDRSRVRTGHADRNLAVTRHLALNLLKQEQSVKVGVKAKCKKAAWDHDYLLRILSQ